MPLSCRGTATDRLADSARGETLDGSQQHTVQTRFRQHSRAPFVVDAEASPTIDSSPATAAMAIKASRR